MQLEAHLVATRFERPKDQLQYHPKYFTVLNHFLITDYAVGIAEIIGDLNQILPS